MSASDFELTSVRAAAIDVVASADQAVELVHRAEDSGTDTGSGTRGT